MSESKSPCPECEKPLISPLTVVSDEAGESHLVHTDECAVEFRQKVAANIQQDRGETMNSIWTTGGAIGEYGQHYLKFPKCGNRSCREWLDPKEGQFVIADGKTYCLEHAPEEK